MTITLFFHPQSPPSHVAYMVLKELRLDFELVELNLWSGEDASKRKEELIKVNPLGKVPAIKDGDLCIGESRAIAIYLCSKYEDASKINKLYPRSIDEAAKINMGIFDDMDGLTAVQKYLNIDAVFGGKAKGPLPEHLEKVKKYLAQIEATLAEQDYFAGSHLTILDFCKLNMVGMLDMAEFDEWGEYPRIVEWRKRMAELPYYEECHTEGFKRNVAMYKNANEKISQNPQA